jgi:hypothetical protein
MTPKKVHHEKTTPKEVYYVIIKDNTFPQIREANFDIFDYFEEFISEVQICNSTQGILCIDIKL